MPSGEKILISGPAVKIAFGVARSLAPENEVWGIAPFSDPATRTEVDGLGVTTRALDIGEGDFGDLLGVGAEVAVEPVPGASIGSVGDHTKRSSITGPCRVHWRDGFRRMAAHFYPDRVKAG
jgi:hypothetical protein